LKFQSSFCLRKPRNHQVSVEFPWGFCCGNT